MINILKTETNQSRYWVGTIRYAEINWNWSSMLFEKLWTLIIWHVYLIYGFCVPFIGFIKFDQNIILDSQLVS